MPAPRRRSRHRGIDASHSADRARRNVVNARPPAAVAGGNVETSQRIVDVLLRALAQALPEQIPAASSGTMNNLTIGGMDDRPAARSGSLQHVSTMALEGARLQRLLKKSASEPFVSGHDFSRADKSFSSCHPEEAFRPTRDLRFRLRNPVSRSISAGCPVLAFLWLGRAKRRCPVLVIPSLTWTCNPAIRMKNLLRLSS